MTQEEKDLVEELMEDYCNKKIAQFHIFLKRHTAPRHIGLHFLANDLMNCDKMTYEGIFASDLDRIAIHFYETLCDKTTLINDVEEYLRQHQIIFLEVLVGEKINPPSNALLIEF